MTKKLKLKRSQDISTYTPDIGEPVYDLKRKQLHIGDGSTAGGVICKDLYYTPMLTSDVINAEVDTCILVDCSQKPIEINLPNVEGLVTGSVVKIIDAKYAASAVNYIEVKSLVSINNSNESFIVDLPYSCIIFIYVSETQNWIVDLGGVIIPSLNITTTDDLIFNDGQLGIQRVPFAKGYGSIDMGTF